MSTKQDEEGGEELIWDADVQQDRGYLKQSKEVEEIGLHVEVIIFGSLAGAPS